jgi:putative transferase (TIGR04331 family)
LELEYADVDEFVSWGWSQLPDHPALNGIAVNDLPSPWLSERKRYWAGLNSGGEREYDFLLMPNMVKRFPAAPHGASTSRIDLVEELACSLKDLVRKVTEKGLRILHKPYNPTTVKVMAKTMKELESIGGNKYSCFQQLDKGLTYELLQQCHVVLWDQPGTGFLECISSNIPTMVYWPRIYSQEEEWAKPIFLELEQQGIIHRNTDSLIEEMLRFKKSSLLWMNDPRRLSLINRFCREFAWASEGWPEYWRQYLDGLDHE